MTVKIYETKLFYIENNEGQEMALDENEYKELVELIKQREGLVAIEPLKFKGGDFTRADTPEEQLPIKTYGEYIKGL